MTPFESFDFTKSHSVYFVDIIRSTKSVLVCNFCSQAVQLDYEPKIDPKWTRKKNLQVLVNNTNPDLGSVDETSPPSDRQLEAMLDGIAMHAARGCVSREVGPGVICGSLLGLALGIPIGMVLHNRGAMKNIKDDGTIVCSLMCIALGIVGFVVGLIIDSRRRFKRNVIQLLKDAIARNKLEISNVQAAAKSSKHRLSSIVMLLNG